MAKDLGWKCGPHTKLRTIAYDSNDSNEVLPSNGKAARSYSLLWLGVILARTWLTGTLPGSGTPPCVRRPARLATWSKPRTMLTCRHTDT